MKTRLLKRWRWLCKISKVDSKFLRLASAYRSPLGDLFFAWHMKRHHLYVNIRLECDIIGISPYGIWRETHPLHYKYAPSCRLKSRAGAFVCDIDFACMYMTPIRPIHFIEVDHDFKLSEDISKICHDAS